MTQLAPAPSAVRSAFHEELDPSQKSALLSWLAFTATFGGLRALTYSIRAGKGPFRNISLGGEHLHHYMWGIALLSGVGAVAVRGEERQRRHPALAHKLRRGQPALIVDEFALLLDLRDVYWAKEGRISIDIGVGGHRPERVLLRGAADTPQAATGPEAERRPGRDRQAQPRPPFFARGQG